MPTHFSTLLPTKDKNTAGEMTGPERALCQTVKIVIRRRHIYPLEVRVVISFTAEDRTLKSLKALLY